MRNSYPLQVVGRSSETSGLQFTLCNLALRTFQYIYFVLLEGLNQPKGLYIMTLIKFAHYVLYYNKITVN